MTWDGNERRKMPDDHDVLIRLESKLDIALEQLLDHEGRIRLHDKFIYGFAGAFLLVEVIFKLIK